MDIYIDIHRLDWSMCVCRVANPPESRIQQESPELSFLLNVSWIWYQTPKIHQKQEIKSTMLKCFWGRTPRPPA